MKILNKFINKQTGTKMIFGANYFTCAKCGGDIGLDDKEINFVSVIDFTVQVQFKDILCCKNCGEKFTSMRITSAAETIVYVHLMAGKL